MRTLKQSLWPYKIRINKPEDHEIEIWLSENMGVLKNRWNIVYNYSYCDYYFRESDDALLFTMRWT